MLFLFVRNALNRTEGFSPVRSETAKHGIMARTPVQIFGLNPHLNLKCQQNLKQEQLLITRFEAIYVPEKTKVGSLY